MAAFKTFRSYFFRGLAAMLPTVLTIWIFVQCYNFVQDNISIHINRGLVRLIVLSVKDYPDITEEEIRSFLIAEKPELLDQERRGELAIHIQREDVRQKVQIQKLEELWVHGPGAIAGFIVALLAVCVVGVIMASVVGKTLWRMVEGFLGRTPLLRKVYPYIKQITDFLFAEKKLSFMRVVAVQYPRKGLWSVALVTGSGLKKVNDSSDKELLTIFVPTSPTPFTGYVIMTPKDETIDLDMTIEEAMRFTVSGGVITPSTILTDSLVLPTGKPRAKK